MLRSSVTSHSVHSSPSPRRAWIEIVAFPICFFAAVSRPPHGGRGLKCLSLCRVCKHFWSPSPRRAWIEMLRQEQPKKSLKSPSPRRAWIEIRAVFCFMVVTACRPPHGGRGLKYARLDAKRSSIKSRPPHGGRGLKFDNRACPLCSRRRPPHGGRGLKLRPSRFLPLSPSSPSPRRAWIEILEQ